MNRSSGSVSLLHRLASESLMPLPYLSAVLALVSALAWGGCVEVSFDENEDEAKADEPYRTQEQQWHGPNFCAVDYQTGDKEHLRTDLIFYHPEASAVVRRDTYQDQRLIARQASERDEMLRLTGLATDEDGDTQVDHKVEFTYGTADRIIEERTDLDGDGSVNETLRRDFFGANTRPAREEVDTDGDGAAERWRDFDYEGATLTMTSGASDPNGDHRVVRVEYEPVFSIPLFIKTDFDADGVFDEVETWDVQGQYVFGVDIDRDGDGAADWRMERTFSDGLGLTQESIDDNGDGTIDEIADYVYDCRPPDALD